MSPLQPTHVDVSIGTAAVLGLAHVPMAVAPTTAYFMLGGRCLMNCAFCAQARESQADLRYLSRVTWPEYPLADALHGLAQAASRGSIHRACLQVTFTADALERSLAILWAARAASDVPFDVAFLPRDLNEVRQILVAGADHVGFGLDAASKEVFHRVKGGSWERNLTLIEQAALAFPGRVAIHLIVGLGETERQMVERIQWAHERGITVGLFAFTPVRGARLVHMPPPPLATYRRMQAARWLIVHDQIRAGEMAFDAHNHLSDLGVPLPPGGEAFQTSGCPDCNRPFYNEQPGGPLYNYPRPLTAEETARAIQEMEVEVRC